MVVVMVVAAIKMPIAWVRRRIAVTSLKMGEKPDQDHKRRQSPAKHP
jgi:hypothetical protein